MLHEPAVVVNQDWLLQDCGRKSTDQDGYVFMTSNSAKLEEQIVPLLECFNRSTLRLKTKYTLILDFSEDNDLSRCESYSYFFHNLWDVFGIINFAILPAQNQSLCHPTSIVSYNPFLARHHSSPRRGLNMNTLTQDVREVMVNRFHNMHGHHLNSTV